MPRHFGPPTEADYPAIAAMLTDAFAGPLDGSEQWARSHAIENLRVMRDRADAAPGAMLVRIPMGQYFGGRAVPMVGIAGVAAALPARGAGLAREMMAAAIREMAAAGTPLSALYASTRPLYRQSGYESAGHRFEIACPIDRLPRFQGCLPVRPLSRDDQPAMERCYREVASRQAGMLDRGVYVWDRVWKFRETPFRGFGAFAADGTLRGYVMLSQKRPAEFGKHDVTLSDAIMPDADGARALCTFLAGLATMGDQLRFFGGADHPLTMLLPHHYAQVKLQEAWMLRVVSVPAALEARGYPPGLRARIRMDIADEVVEDNRGAWTLEVEGGRGRVRREAGACGLCLTSRGLAAVYSGLLTPRRAAACGLAGGDDESMDLAAAVFAGPSPAMPDFF